MKICGIEFEHSIFNASGVNCTTFEELSNLAKSDSSAVMMKSCTIEPRQGNPEPRYKYFAGSSLQRMGLPNLGYKAYLEFAKRLKEDGCKKPIIASLAGLKIDSHDLLVMCEEFLKSPNIDMIELNVSCPNVEKSITAYNLQRLEYLLADLCLPQNKPIGLKLPMYPDPRTQELVALMVLELNVSFITTMNSIANAYRDGFVGALGGAQIIPIALGQVKMFHNFLGGQVPIIGVGGISTGRTVVEFLKVGASAVQIGTQLKEEGVGCFSRLLKECQVL